MAEQIKWEHYGDGTYRQRVDGGFLYRCGGHFNYKGLVFVPDAPLHPLGSWYNPINIYSGKF